MHTPDELLSAQVILTVDDPATVEQLTNHFGRAGFQVGPFWGTSFSLSAPASTFHQYFEVPFATSLDPFDRLGAADRKLESKKVPVSLRPSIAAITISRLPDFGAAGNY